MWDKREMIFIDYICRRRRCQDLGEAPNVTKNDTHLTWNLSDDIVKVLCWLSWWGLEWDVVSCLFSYAKMYVKLRQYHLQVRAFPLGQPNGIQVPLNIARFKKSVSSVLWVQLALVTCYIPFLVVVILMTYGRMSGDNLQVAFNISATLTYLNSSVNPILYCWRMRAVRQAARDTIKQLNCCK